MDRHIERTLERGGGTSGLPYCIGGRFECAQGDGQIEPARVEGMGDSGTKRLPYWLDLWIKNGMPYPEYAQKLLEFEIPI